MKYSIELSDEYIEKLFSLVGYNDLYSDLEYDDELEIEEAIKVLIDNSWKYRKREKKRGMSSEEFVMIVGNGICGAVLVGIAIYVIYSFKNRRR